MSNIATAEKFTPGPWEVDGFDLVSIIKNERPGTNYPAWRHISKCDYGYSNPEKHFEENKANAKLIAAAPELLEACQEMMKHIIETDFDVSGTPDKLLNKWNAAIQKAIQ